MFRNKSDPMEKEAFISKIKKFYDAAAPVTSAGLIDKKYDKLI